MRAYYELESMIVGAFALLPTTRPTRLNLLCDGGVRAFYRLDRRIVWQACAATCLRPMPKWFNMLTRDAGIIQYTQNAKIISIEAQTIERPNLH